MSLSNKELIEKIEEQVTHYYINNDYNPLDPNKAATILYLFLIGTPKNWIRRDYGFLLPTINRLLNGNSEFLNLLKMSI